MKNLITFIILQLFIYPFWLRANENFSVEIQALTLVMERYEKNNKSELELDLKNDKPTYIALKQDECNATVKVTETTGIEIVNTELFDVNVCKKEIYKIVN